MSGIALYLYVLSADGDEGVQEKRIVASSYERTRVELLRGEHGETYPLGEAITAVRFRQNELRIHLARLEGVEGVEPPSPQDESFRMRLVEGADWEAVCPGVVGVFSFVSGAPTSSIAVKTVGAS